jgi:hypothetical protein
MTRFTASALVGLAFAATALPAAAQTPHAARAEQAVARQSVMICATDVATRRAYQREHGVQPVFVTARETVEARRKGQTWDAPRCMTEREYNRLVATTNTRAGV